jgi:DNA anti-recombination protein RmuC
MRVNIRHYDNDLFHLNKSNSMYILDRLKKIKTKYEEDTKRSLHVHVAKHDEALAMISQLQAENELLKEQLSNSQNPRMHFVIISLLYLQWAKT